MPEDIAWTERTERAASGETADDGIDRAETERTKK